MEPGGVEEEACRLLGVGRLWNALVRPASVSPSRIQHLSSPAITLKLDGVRTALLMGRREATTLRASDDDGAGSLAQVDVPTSAEPLTLLDCEERKGELHAFDALIVAGRDVRGLPLEGRISALEGALPKKGVSVKPYKFLPSGALGQGPPRALARGAVEAMGCHSQAADGLILLDSADPYWVPPLKFKPIITCDFVLESSHSSDDFVLLVGCGGQPHGLAPWRERNGTVARARLPLRLADQLAQRLGSRPISRRDAVVAECTRTGQDTFRICALRPDRTRPNRAAVVAENVQLQQAGCHRPEWLTLALPSADPVRRFWRYVEACWRVLVAVAVAAIASPCCTHRIEVSARDSCACAPRDLWSMQGLLLPEKMTGPPAAAGAVKLSFLNLYEAHSSPEGLAAGSGGACAVGALVLQPEAGGGRDLYQCRPGGGGGKFRLQVASPAVHQGTRLRLAGLDARAALQGFEHVNVQLPVPSVGLGVAGEAASGLVAGLSAFLWVRPCCCDHRQ